MFLSVIFLDSSMALASSGGLSATSAPSVVVDSINVGWYPDSVPLGCLELGIRKQGRMLLSLCLQLVVHLVEGE